MYRPFGGVITLINNDLRKNTVTIHSDERFVIVKVGQYLLVNMYFPCFGTADRLIVYENLLSDIAMWRDRYRDRECVIAGDFNCDLDGTAAVSLMVQRFRATVLLYAATIYFLVKNYLLTLT